ncbi:MAG: hypothetical protein J2P48_17825 [Alphaproteobacteria bacterium]|nr:hypothetical protein [Alphaproteobacteria bacterium]
MTDGVSGSVGAARRVATGQEPCEILAGADYKDIDLLLKPAGFADYDILFAQRRGPYEEQPGRGSG